MARAVKRQRKGASRSRDDDYGEYNDDADDEFEDDDDDDEFEPPRRSKPSSKRRARDEDDDDDEDDEDEDEPPRRHKPSTRRARDEEDDEPRRSRKTRRSRDDDEDDDDDEERPPSRKSGGWKQMERTLADTSTFPNRVKLEPDPQLLKFLDEEPTDSWAQHWIEREGRKSFKCIGKDKCPLCDIGDKTSMQAAFNVVRVDEGDPVNLVFMAGPQIARILQDESKARPLTSGYFSVAKPKGKGAASIPRISRVKERDVEEDWNIEPLTEKETAALRKKVWKSEDIIQDSTRKELLRIAKEIVGDDDDD